MTMAEMTNENATERKREHISEPSEMRVSAGKRVVVVDARAGDAGEGLAALFPGRWGDGHPAPVREDDDEVAEKPYGRDSQPQVPRVQEEEDHQQAIAGDVKWHVKAVRQELPESREDDELDREGAEHEQREER